jgi:hypothetical protein
VGVLVPALLGAAFLGYSGATIAGSVPMQPRRDYSTLDVCQFLPGDVIARALGGKLSGTRGMKDKAFSRCTYTIVPPGSDKLSGYGDLDNLRGCQSRRFAPCLAHIKTGLKSSISGPFCDPWQPQQTAAFRPRARRHLSMCLSCVSVDH